MPDLEPRACQVRRASDGAVVRVQGDLPQEVIDYLGAKVKALLDGMCKALSDVPMPAAAQRMHDRETYWCGLPSGHDGPHRWPARDASGRTAIAEWP